MSPALNILIRGGRGLVLLLTGALMLSMALSGDLWQYLNPGFAPWITGAGVLILLLGCLAPFAPPGSRPAWDLIPVAAFLVFLGLAGWSLNRPLVADEPDWSPPESDLYYPAPKPLGESRLTWEGREYVKMNLSELFALADYDKAPEHVAVRGMVLRAGDGNGRVLLVRAQIVCCLADALGLGFELAGEGLEELEAGQWVRVLGGLEPAAPDLATGQVDWPGVVLVVLGDRHVLVPDRITRIDPPEMPYIFDVRDEEPFEY